MPIGGLLFCNAMDELIVLRTVAACATILAAAMVAAT